MIRSFLGSSDKKFEVLFRRGHFLPLVEAVQDVLRDNFPSSESTSFLILPIFAKVRLSVSRGLERPLTDSQLTSLVQRISLTMIHSVDRICDHNYFLS